MASSQGRGSSRRKHTIVGQAPDPAQLRVRIPGHTLPEAPQHMDILESYHPPPPPTQGVRMERSVYANDYEPGNVYPENDDYAAIQQIAPPAPRHIPRDLMFGDEEIDEEWHDSQRTPRLSPYLQMEQMRPMESPFGADVFDFSTPRPMEGLPDHSFFNSAPHSDDAYTGEDGAIEVMEYIHSPSLSPTLPNSTPEQQWRQDRQSVAMQTAYTGWMRQADARRERFSRLVQEQTERLRQLEQLQREGGW